MRLRLPALGDPAEGLLNPAELDQRPATFKSPIAKFKELPDMVFTIQVAPEDCTGCTLCVEACPVKDKTQAGRRRSTWRSSSAAGK